MIYEHTTGTHTTIYVYRKVGQRERLVQCYHRIGAHLFDGVGVDNRNSLTEDEARSAAAKICVDDLGNWGKG